MSGHYPICPTCKTEVSRGREMSAAYDNGKRYPRAHHTPDRCARFVDWNRQHAEAQRAAARATREAAAPLRMFAVLTAAGVPIADAQAAVLAAVQRRMDKAVSA